MYLDVNTNTEKFKSGGEPLNSAAIKLSAVFFPMGKHVYIIQ